MCIRDSHYAVEILRVKHILVVGHYGCGGVKAALRNNRLGLIDNWLRHVQDVRDKHRDLLQAVEGGELKADRLCELNVIEQAVNVCETTVVREAWDRGQSLEVHGLIYGLADGLIRDMGLCAGSADEMLANYDRALGALR